MKDRRIDPRTRDYVLDDQGGTECATTGSAAVYHALATQRGTVALDPKAGSQLHELDRATDETAPLAAQIALLALQRLIRAGVILDAQARAELSTVGTLELSITIITQQGESEVTLGL